MSAELVEPFEHHSSGLSPEELEASIKHAFFIGQLLRSPTLDYEVDAAQRQLDAAIENSAPSSRIVQLEQNLTYWAQVRTVSGDVYRNSHPN